LSITRQELDEMSPRKIRQRALEWRKKYPGY
jgi:hypothetical protein